MRHKFPSVVLALSGLLLLAVPALAHHSFSSVFDYKRPVTVSGVLSKIEWQNPHVYFYLDVKDSNGRVETWSFESYSPSSLRERGISREAMRKRIGEPLTIKSYRAKDNTKTLAWVHAFVFAKG